MRGKKDREEKGGHRKGRIGEREKKFKIFISLDANDNLSSSTHKHESKHTCGRTRTQRFSLMKSGRRQRRTQGRRGETKN